MDTQGRRHHSPTRAIKVAVVFSLALAQTQRLTIAAAVDGSTTPTVLIQGQVPEGAIVLVCGGLGVAFVALIFVIIQSRLAVSSKKVMEERAKARDFLRLRGGIATTGGSPGVPSSPFHTKSRLPDIVPHSTTTMSEASGSGSDTLHKATPPHQHSPIIAVRGYSGSSTPRASMHEMSYSSFTSIRDLDYLVSSGRRSSIDARRPSEDTLSRASRPGSHYLQNQRRHMARDRPLSSYRLQQSAEMGRSASHASSPSHGTAELYLTRSHSRVEGMAQGRDGRGAGANVIYGSADTASSRPQTRRQHPLELSERADVTPDESRRNSTNALLGEDYLSAGPSTVESSQQGPASLHSTESFPDHSNGLLPATQHPLSATQRQQNLQQQTSVSRPPAVGSSNPVREGHLWQEQVAGSRISSRSRPTQAPPIRTSQSAVQAGMGAGSLVASPPSSYGHGPAHSSQTSSSLSSHSNGYQRPDEENLIHIQDDTQSGQFTQPVSSGNGRRGVPGRPAGSPV